MDLEAFHEDVISSVRVAAEVGQNFLRAAFVEDAGGKLSDAEELVNFQACAFEGVGSRKRKLEVDGYAFDEADGSMSLLIAQFFNEDDVPSFGAAEAKRLFTCLSSFVDECLSGRLTDGTIDEAQPGYGLAAEIFRIQSSIIRFRFYLVSDGRLSSRTQEWPESEISGIPVEFHIWDVERFHRAHMAASGRDSLEVSFSNAEMGFEGLPFLDSGAGGSDYAAYLCMIPGSVLADLYSKFGSRLLEGNVRAFLSTKGKVNAGMQETIAKYPEMFFAYNNGIAATAEEVTTNPSGTRLVSAKNLQIVNGGQTTASLAAAKRSGLDLSLVRVQMKLSVVPPVEAERMIPLIARYANSQNKVNDADFFANHPYHIRLEELSRRVWTPVLPGKMFGSHWFYERARGQYLNEQVGLTKSEKEIFKSHNPKPQLLTKTDVAKLENTWRGFPHKVSQGAQKNFLHFADWLTKEWSDNADGFNENYFRHIACLAILFRHTEALVSKQSWYQGGYRANVVTYSLAKLQYMILKQAGGSRLSLNSIWDNQSVGTQLSDQIALIAEKVFGVLTWPKRPKDNVTEWAKMEKCWTEVQAIKIDLDDEIIELAPDARLAEAQEVVAAGGVPVGHGLFAKTSVMSIDGALWKAMHDWGISKGYLSSRESDLLRAAARIPKFVPSAKDCSLILKIKSKLEVKGFTA